MESMRQGIGVPPESPAAAEAAAERQAEEARHPVPEGRAPDAALGGTSDAESAADEVHMNAALNRGLPGDRTGPGGSREDQGTG